jgi:hypothetical protein
LASIVEQQGRSADEPGSPFQAAQWYLLDRFQRISNKSISLLAQTIHYGGAVDGWCRWFDRASPQRPLISKPAVTWSLAAIPAS